MVGLMKFSLDFCRLLGLSGSSDESPEEMDTGALPKQNDHTLSQGDENAGADSELDESEESEPEEVEGIGLSKVEEKPVAPSSKSSSGPPLASGNKSNRQPTARSSEEDPGWDVNSAFVANAVSHIRPKAKSKGAHKSKENKENESRTGEVSFGNCLFSVLCFVAIGRLPIHLCRKGGAHKSSFLFTPEKGIRFVQEGQYTQALSLFTEAIKCDPKDYRFFGNRSYCYCCLEQYPLALADAEKSIQMAPDWPKGYYRRGSALMGLKRYCEAEKAMEQVLKLDQDCEEAVNDLLYCKVQQLMVRTGFLIVVKFFSLSFTSPCNSLWVGNVTTELTEKHLRDLFKIYGEIDSIRVLHERFCAFVNFKNANMASSAIEKLNGHFIENTRLVVRYPDRRIQRVLPTPVIPQPAGAAGPRRRGPVNGDECYFWRTTGCHFGDRCRYKHIPDHRGKDWQP
ncbi:uncharacterized protein [Sinocyclocheilus grahami]|uniref:uncharacterized protein n=1 Tax=Sinocyclocheilus grahami TaxID=75366 RepID=UPI0007AD0A69|nr:PREDICTED: uncharacterized protein LOC107586089 [Sinocyclocheilus grahami]